MSMYFSEVAGEGEHMKVVYHLGPSGRDQNLTTDHF
jgi:hypothetical protein